MPRDNVLQTSDNIHIVPVNFLNEPEMVLVAWCEFGLTASCVRSRPSALGVDDEAVAEVDPVFPKPRIEVAQGHGHEREEVSCPAVGERRPR